MTSTLDVKPVIEKSDGRVRKMQFVWRSLFFVFATILTLAICMRCGFYTQDVHYSSAEPVGEKGWSVLLRKTPIRLFLHSPEPPNADFSIIVNGSTLDKKRGGAWFDAIIKNGDGRFNQFNNRIFFSLPTSQEGKAINEVVVKRPLFLHYGWELFVVCAFIFLLSKNWGSAVAISLNNYYKWCETRRLPSCLTPLFIAATVSSLEVLKMIPFGTLSFSLDSEGYLAPETESIRRPFAYSLFLKLADAATGNLAYAGGLQWILHIASIFALCICFERHFKSPVWATIIGIVAMVKLGSIQWIFFAGPDSMFGAFSAFFLVCTLEAVLGAGFKPKINSVASSFCYFAAISLRPIGLVLGAVQAAVATYCIIQKRKLLAIFFLLSTIAVPFLSSATDQAFSSLWQSSFRSSSLTGVCLLGSALWFMDKTVSTPYPQLRDMLVDDAKKLATEYKNSPLEVKQKLDYEHWNSLGWGSPRRVFEQWRLTDEARQVSSNWAHTIEKIEPTEPSLSKVYTSLAISTFTQKPKEAAELLAARLHTYLFGHITGDWLVDLSTQLSSFSSSVSTQTKSFQWISRQDFSKVTTTDLLGVNRYLTGICAALNILVSSLVVSIPMSGLMLFRAGKDSVLRAGMFTALMSGWIQFTSYCVAVCIMQPPLNRYAEPMVPIVLFLAIGQSLFLWSSMVRRSKSIERAKSNECST